MAPLRSSCPGSRRRAWRSQAHVRRAEALPALRLAHHLSRRPRRLRRLRGRRSSPRARPPQFRRPAGQPRSRDALGAPRPGASRLLGRDRRPASRPRGAGARRASAAVDARAPRLDAAAGRHPASALRKRRLPRADRDRRSRPSATINARVRDLLDVRGRGPAVECAERTQRFCHPARAPRPLARADRLPARRVRPHSPSQLRSRALPRRQGDQLRRRPVAHSPAAPRRLPLGATVAPLEG